MESSAVNEKFAQRLDAVEVTLEKLMSKMSKLYDAVVGNETFDQTGIISRIKKLEIENDKNQALKNKLIGAFIVGGASWTVIWELIKYVINK